MAGSDPLIQSFHEAQSKLVVQTADLPLGTLASMVENSAIDLEPGFQRRERWTHEKQSALIESFLLNVPVPPVYLSEEASGTYTAIDGKQRLRAISDFIRNRFRLRKLERLHEAEGTQFSELPTEITNALELRPFLRVVTLLKQTDPLLKYEVFLRLNRGGESLNNQEIRNVAFRGSLNDAVYDLSQEAFLKQQLKITDSKSAAFREMADAELVLRFLTLRDRYSAFSGSLVQEMDEFMRSHQNAKANEVDSYKDSFRTALSRCQSLWGDHAFHRPEGTGWRDQALAGLYDAQMISVSHVTSAQFQHASSKQAAVIAATRNLFSDSEFEKAVRTGTNTPARIKLRVDKMKAMLKAL
jgi:hypothetical protein